jgi:hypothetical protein
MKFLGNMKVYNDLTATGAIAGITKSFLIPHPFKHEKKLRYGSLEGPENGVYIRGRLKGSDIIELPDYWEYIIDPESITVSLTPVGLFQDLYVRDYDNKAIIIGNGNIFRFFTSVDCFYVVYGERCDVPKLEVEIDA